MGWLTKHWLGILITTLLAIFFFLVGASVVNIESLVSQNAETADRLVRNIIITSGAALLVGLFLMIVNIVTKRFGRGLRDSFESAIKIVVIFFGRRRKYREIRENAKVFFSGVRVFFTLLLVSFLTGLVVILFQSLLNIASTMNHQQQVAKMKDQNDLITLQNQMQVIQQHFEMTRSEADRQYEEISSILLDRESTPQMQVYALKKIPHAMTREVILIEDNKKHFDGEVDKVYRYPNIPRLRDLLSQYLRDDRVGQSLEMAGLDVEDSNLRSPQERRVLEKLEPISTQLLITLAQLGQEVDRVAMWNISEFQSSERIAFPDFQLSKDPDKRSQEIDLTHISTETWAGAQIPCAFYNRQSSTVIFPKNANFEDANLEGVNLRGARFLGAIFHNARLDGADLGNAHLTGANLSSARIVGANLSGADMTRTHSEQANLSYSILNEAHLEGSYHWIANFDGADLTDARMEGAFLEMSSLKGTILHRAHLEGAKLHRGRLIGADLTNVYLSGADLCQAIVEGSDLTGAHLEGAHLGGLALTVQFSATLILRAPMED